MFFIYLLISYSNAEYFFKDYLPIVLIISYTLVIFKIKL